MTFIYWIDPVLWKFFFTANAEPMAATKNNKSGNEIKKTGRGKETNFSTLPKIDSTPDTALPSDETLAEFCCCVALAINWGKECGNGELEAMKLLTLLVLRAFLSN